MLSPDRLERLRGYLLEEQANLHHQIVGLKESSQGSDVGSGNHMAEDATAAFDQAAAVSLLREHQTVLAQVERALAHMANGTYGLCERCREQIDFGGLKAIPHAPFCMNCQRFAEL